MYYQDLAIVLNRKVFQEDDLLINFYTKKYGKIVLQAVGAKKIKSKLAGHIEPMNLVKIEWVAGKTLNKLTGAVVSSSFSDIKNNLDKINYAQYFLNVVDKITQVQHSDKNVFEFLKNVLEKLTSAEEKNLALIKLSFDYKILFLFGYNPVQRKELNFGEKEAVKKIINLSVDELIKMKFNKQILNKLYFKAKRFLEEVVEREVGVCWNFRVSPPFEGGVRGG